MSEKTPTPPRIGPAYRYATTRDWPGYFAAVEGKGPRETTVFALEAFAREGVPGEVVAGWQSEAGPARGAGFGEGTLGGAPGAACRVTRKPVAVDLGCGEGRDALEMLRRGWRVVAIDGHESAFDWMRKRPGLLEHADLEARLDSFETCSIPECLLLNASFSLPFCHPDAFDALWTVIRAAIRPGGRFAGQFFGERDSWATIPDRSHHTRVQVERMLLGWEVELFQEEEKDSTDAQGVDKHWHVFHVVARRALRETDEI